MLAGSWVSVGLAAPFQRKYTRRTPPSEKNIGCHWVFPNSYPLVMTNITIKDHHFQWVNQLF